MKALVRVTADLSRVAPSKIPIKKGADGQNYYHIKYDFQVTFYSGDTAYELIYDNINYGRVTSEYV